MSRLLVVKDGLHITLPRFNETNVETIFNIDESNNIVQMFTFDSQILVNPTDLANVLSGAIPKEIDKGFLFYSFRYQISFMHNLMQTVPLLEEYLEKYKEYKLLVPAHHYSELYKDIFKLLNIQDDSIFLLEDNTIYTVKSMADRKKWIGDAFVITEAAVKILNSIRGALSITQNIHPKRRIYLQRDGTPNKLFGNDETGAIRRILNEDELVRTLTCRGFEIVKLGDKYLHQKNELLSNAAIVITQLGANCMNLMFTNLPSHVIFLGNSSAIGENTFVNLLGILNNSTVSYTTLLDSDDTTHFDPKNKWNCAFSVDIPRLTKYIDNYLSALS